MGNFQVQAPQGVYVRRGDVTEGFLRLSLGGLYKVGLVLRYVKTLVMIPVKIGAIKVAGSSSEPCFVFIVRSTKSCKRYSKTYTYTCNLANSS